MRLRMYSLQTKKMTLIAAISNSLGSYEGGRLDKDKEFVESTILKKPADCTKAEMDAFCKLMTEGGEVDAAAVQGGDGQFTGKQIAHNMWHCTNCNATPIDIFPEPFWLEASR